VLLSVGQSNFSDHFHVCNILLSNAGTLLLLLFWSFKRIMKETVNYVRRYQQMASVSGTGILLRTPYSVIYHEFRTQVQYKFSSSTIEQNNVPLRTKGIAGLYMSLIPFSCLLINYLVNTVELG